MKNLKCEECGKKLNSDGSNRADVQLYGGDWITVCLACARKLKASDSLGAAMDDVDF